MKSTNKDKSLELLHQLKLAIRQKNVNKEIDALMALGEFFREDEDFEKAGDYYRQCIDLASSRNLPLDASFSCRRLSEISAEQGLREDAIKYAAQFRRYAEKSGNHSQIQLSLHVTGYVFQKLWAVSGNHHDRADGETAITWLLKSMDYLKKTGHLIDGDKNSIEIGGKSDHRKAKLDCLCAGIYANLGQQKEAEKFWKAGYMYSVRSNNRDFKYELQLTKMDFHWECALKVAQNLVNFAPKKLKGQALMELAQATFYAGNVRGSQDILLTILSKHRSSLTLEEGYALETRLIFFYKHFFRLKIAEDVQTPPKKSRRMYELIADELVDYSIDKSETKKMALKYYECMLRKCTSDKERLPAFASMACIQHELKMYAESLKIHQQELVIKEKLNMNAIEITKTRLEMFRVKCLGKLASVEQMTAEFEGILKALPLERIILRGKLYLAYTDFLNNLGLPSNKFREIAEDLQAKENDDETAEEDEHDVSNESDDDDDMYVPEVILRKCKDMALRRGTYEQIIADRDKVINSHGETRMHVAAKNDDKSELEKLINASYNVNARDYGGWTPLSEAVSAGLRDNVLLLLKAKAKVDCVSNEQLEGERESETVGGGLTPLMEACTSGDVAIARDLLTFGASVAKKNSDGWTAVDFLRNYITTLDQDDPDDATEMPYAQTLVSEMETKQTQLGLSIRKELPPLNRKHTVKPGRKTNHPQHKKRRSLDDLSPSKQNLDIYQRTMRKLGPSTRFDAMDGESDMMLSSPVKRSTSPRSYADENLLDIDDINTFDADLPSVSGNSIAKHTANVLDGFTIDDCGNDRKRKLRSSNGSDRKRQNRRSSPCRTTRFTRSSPINVVDHPQFSPNDEIINLDSSRSSSPIMFRRTRHSGSPPVANESFSTPTSGSTPKRTDCITVKLKFVSSTGSDDIRHAYLISLQSDAIVDNLTHHCLKLLPAHQHQFDFQLDDGCEMAPGIALKDLLAGSSEPLKITCRLKPPTAESLYRGYASCCDEDIIAMMKSFDLSGNLDASPIELDTACGDVLRAVMDSGRTVKHLNLDFTDINNVDSLVLGKLIGSCSLFSARASGLTDGLLCKLVANSITFNDLTTLDLSVCNMSSGKSIAAMLALTPMLSDLSLAKIHFTDGIKELGEAISGLGALSTLDLSMSSFGDGSLVQKVLSSCDSLVVLYLTGTPTDKLDFSSSWLPNVRRLSLSGCEINDWDSWVEWMALGQVEWIDVSCTTITTENIRQIMQNRMAGPFRMRAIRCHLLNYCALLQFIMNTYIASNSTMPVMFECAKDVIAAFQQRTGYYSRFIADL